ncbi:MAG TPA: AbrB/MazE/SpoVT family DNA-binding domain-containing protein [archaeon]|nr:AbrB/MazE/SpoVT family DNA-binding domain-containing protein [archaeon]
MEFVTRARKVGGSLMVTIEKKVAEELDIHENDEIEIEVKKRKKSFFGALKGIGPFTEEDRIDFRE